MTHAISALASPGATLTYTAGRTTITLQYVREGAYTVVVYAGTYRVEDQCASFDSEATARAVARMYATLAKAEADAGTTATLADTVPAGTHRQIPPTMAGAQLADVTGPQHRALATAATLGRVERGRGGEPVQVLKALARKGYLRLVMKPGTRYDVDHAVITAAGERELARLDAHAARTRRPLGTP